MALQRGGHGHHHPGLLRRYSTCAPSELSMGDLPGQTELPWQADSRPRTADRGCCHPGPSGDRGCYWLQGCGAPRHQAEKALLLERPGDSRSSWQILGLATLCRLGRSTGSQAVSLLVCREQSRRAAEPRAPTTCPLSSWHVGARPVPFDDLACRFAVKARGLGSTSCRRCAARHVDE